jgi:putative intracellular protease/amidase
MEQPLAGKTVAILVANGFEEVDMTEPQRALLAAGTVPKLISPEQGLVNGWHGKAWGHYFPIDSSLSTALAADFDALLIPGGERGVEKLAGNPHTKRFIRGFMDGGKPVAAIGHAPILLIGAERANGRMLACSTPVRVALEAAGARISEEPIAVDGNLITARSDAEFDSVKIAIVKLFAELGGNLQVAA